MLISLENISKYYNGATVLDNVALTVEDDDRIGLVGVNGCGKSTLLRIIAGLERPETQPEPNTARITRSKHCRIGFLEQDSGLERGCSVMDEVRGVFRELLDVSDRLRELEAAMSAPDAHNNEARFTEISEEYARLQTYFESNDGYLINVKIGKILNGMGFGPETYDRVISTLSGGEKTRLALAKLLLENPDLLILDEPTNHLDFNTVIWLEDYLKDCKSALIIVSHDRYLIDGLATSVCEIERGVLRRFKGNYTAFAAQKEALITRLVKEYEEQAAEMEKLREYIDKNLVRASTSNMAKSRRKKLEAMPPLEKPAVSHKSAKLRFEFDRIPPLDVLAVNDIDISVGEGENRVTLTESLSFAVRRGEKLGIIGSNGVGKSSLLKIIQNQLPRSKGGVEWAKNVKISYFDQENARLNPNDTVISAVHNLYPNMTEHAVRSLLGAVRISGENVFKRVGVISGGERAKLCFAIMSLERGNVLILDEPTNHLDIDTKEVLEDALRRYEGTIIFVSHDRYLLDKLAGKILEITENAAQIFDGGFAGYMERRREREASVVTAAAHPSGANGEKPEKPAEQKTAYRSKEQRANDAKRRLRLKELEELIEQTEAMTAALQEELATPEVCADYQLTKEKYALFEEYKEKAAEYTDEWLALSCE